MQLLQVITASSASVYLHQNLLKGVLHAPMSFFDCTPIGRIINRFAKDIDSLDNILPVSFSSTLTTLGSVLVTTSVLIYTSWYALIAIISLAIPFAFIQRVYVTSSRQLRQLDSTTKSPLYSNFTETLQGLSSIRAYKAQDRFIGINDDRLDHNQACFFASQVVCRWLGVRLEILANVLTFMTSLFAVFMRQHFTVGIIGLAITCTMQVTQSLGWLVLFISDIESNIVSVERIQEYTELDSEAPWQISDKQVDSQWPINGKIQIEDLSVKYRENLQTVINDINIEIEPGEKIGIVGRTGSGKTSLCMALFRIIEATKGKILIDNIDISRLGLHELRSKITIIPQDAVIFAGTVRFNVDPYEIYSDDEIWRVFESVHIKQRINGLTNGLLFTFTEGGNSLSAGEKQLLCMARALLRQSKIVVLDEATASIDMETDRLIQMTIRTALKDATVLTIAHRLHTILDSTRILVLSNGNLQEFDSPNNLVLNSHSFFTKLLQDANINLNNMNNSLI
ncbi:hypothetical protein I4U23_000249 [Adineta vaga]|nr:hypothetical protein I4U23_000249 [Adineta vaga]